uniref:Uncharacterized protein n=1 Tax=Arundo donax TaxID=35708 RepID=A0A0A9AFH8_ARUDO
MLSQDWTPLTTIVVFDIISEHWTMG